MTSVSPALQGFAPAQAQSRQHATDGRDKGSNFAEMVHGAEKPARPAGHSADPAPADAHAARRAFADPAKARPERDAQNKATPPKPQAGKVAKGSADHVETADDTDTPARVSDAAPYQDRLPMLMALGDIRHYAASPGAESGKAMAAEDPGAPGNPSASTVRRNASARIDASAVPSPQHSGSSTTAVEADGPHPARQAANSGPATDAPIHIGDLLAQMPSAPAETNAEAPQGWRPTGTAKTVQTAQSVASLNQARPPSSAGRMDVVSQQSFPAPAQPPVNQTASALAEVIAADDGVRQAFSTAPLGPQTASSVAVPTHVLKIELHPSELGAVTASLRLSGEQLSIEMKPETHEAYRRLSADSDTIIKSLRGLGFDVDKVTILQPSIAAHSAGRADGNSQSPMSAGRDQSSFQPGNPGGSNAGGGRQPGRNDGNGAQDFGRAASPLRERAGDDMYI